MHEDPVQSVAVFDLVEGKEAECLDVLRQLYDLLRRKGYSRDMLLRDSKLPRRYVNVRFWFSEEKRRQAAEDPEVHRYWLRLPELMIMRDVAERLESVPGFAATKEELS